MVDQVYTRWLRQASPARGPRGWRLTSWSERVRGFGRPQGAPLRARGGGGEPRAGRCSPGSGQCVHFSAGCVQFWPGYGRMCSVFPAMCSLPGSAAGGGAGSGRPPGAAESGTHKGYPYRIRQKPRAEAGTHKRRSHEIAAAGASRGPAGVHPDPGNVFTFRLDVFSFGPDMAECVQFFRRCVHCLGARRAGAQEAGDHQGQRNRVPTRGTPTGYD